MVRIRKPAKKEIVELFKARAELTRSQVAEALNISYESARYWLDVLVEEGLINRKRIIKVSKRGTDYVYKVIYISIEKIVYYRTQLALMFYTEVPREKTPDPIAEFRCTVVSDKKGMYDIKAFEDACVYVGVILAPQTWWRRPDNVKSDKPKVLFEVKAFELDESIDKDELNHSVTVYGKLNYCERQAIFFKSHQHEKWRKEHQFWWIEKVFPISRLGDYLYTEDRIKSVEENRIALKSLKVGFDNEKGVMYQA